VKDAHSTVGMCWQMRVWQWQVDFDNADEPSLEWEDTVRMGMGKEQRATDREEVCLHVESVFVFVFVHAAPGSAHRWLFAQDAEVVDEEIVSA
jgi:hypothetical protein